MLYQPVPLLVQRWLAALLALLIGLGPLATPAYAALTPLADEPLNIKNQAKPNIVLTVDDSTSMLFDFLPDYVVTGFYCRNGLGVGSAVCGSPGAASDFTAVGGGKGGYYTQAEYSDIVNYAASRYIAIVPEIDVPGHINAALTAYPELGCSTRPPVPFTRIDVGWSALCVDKEASYALVDDVVRARRTALSVPVMAGALLFLFLAPRLKRPERASSARAYFRSSSIWRVGVTMSFASAAYFGANSFVPDYLRAVGDARLTTAALAALNLSQLPASVLVLAIPERLVGRRGAAPAPRARRHPRRSRRRQAHRASSRRSICRRRA